jgi:hypothetical protein
LIPDSTPLCEIRREVNMSGPITLQVPVIELPSPQNKWEREYQAFRQLLPQLLRTHRGKYVAVHEEQVIDSGDEKLALALRVLGRVGNVAIHVGLVTEDAEAVSRSGVRRDGKLGGDAL